MSHPTPLIVIGNYYETVTYYKYMHVRVHNDAC